MANYFIEIGVGWVKVHGLTDDKIHRVENAVREALASAPVGEGKDIGDIEAGLCALFAAVEMDDPRSEIIQRVKDLVREASEIRMLAAAPSPPLATPTPRGEEETTPDGYEKPCSYCGEECNPFAGNPSLWPLGFPDEGGDGVVAWHHVGCVMDKLREGQEALTLIDSLSKREKELVEALTPSAETKAAYSGEFRMTIRQVDEYGDDQSLDVPVSWTVIKQIMKTILRRARRLAAQTEK